MKLHCASCEKEVEVKHKGVDFVLCAECLKRKTDKKFSPVSKG